MDLADSHALKVVSPACFFELSAVRMWFRQDVEDANLSSSIDNGLTKRKTYASSAAWDVVSLWSVKVVRALRVGQGYIPVTM